MITMNLARVNTGTPQAACKYRRLLCFVSVLLVLLTGCRHEPAEEPVYRLLTATLEEGSAGLRQRNRAGANRIAYAVAVQGNRPEDVAYANEVEALVASTDSLVNCITRLQGGVQAVMKPDPGSTPAVRDYLFGPAAGKGQGNLYPLYRLLRQYREPLSRVAGTDVGTAAFFPPDSTSTNLPRDADAPPVFLQPFRGTTATEALGLLAAYKTRILWLQGQVIEHAQGRLGAHSIRDGRIVLLAHPERDSVSIGSQYAADLYLTLGLDDWYLYKAFINGKPADLRSPKATLRAARGKDGKPQQWEARLYLFNEYNGKDTVLVIRRPFPLSHRTPPTTPEKP